MPNESKPTKSICKSLTTHLNLLKDRVSELSAYLDDSEADQTVSDQEIDTIQIKARWIEDKFNKILTQWEDYLETNYDDDEHDRAEPTYKECGELSSKIRRRVDTFLKKHQGLLKQHLDQQFKPQATMVHRGQTIC